MLRKRKGQHYRFYVNKTTLAFHYGVIDFKKQEVYIEGYNYPFHSTAVLDDFYIMERSDYLKHLKKHDPKKWRNFIDRT